MFRGNFRYKCSEFDRKDKYFAMFYPHCLDGKDGTNFDRITRQTSFFNKTFNKPKDMKYVCTTSIDPASVNLGLYIVLLWEDLSTTSLVLERIDLTEQDKSGKYEEIKKYDTAIKKLDEYFELINESHFVLIETQMNKNPDMLRMAQHFITYLSMKLKDNKARTVILELSSKLKTGTLGYIKTKGIKGDKAKRERKKFCIKKAEEILHLTNDPFVSHFKRAKNGSGPNKKDDKADVICQFWGFLIMQEKHPTRNWFDRLVKSDKKIKKMLKI